MIWIFPMAGRGTRTQQFGSFKPFIEIGGRKMLAWLFVSIRSKIRPEDILVFITTEQYAFEFDVETGIEKILSPYGLGRQVHLVTCPTVPPGPSASVYTARAHYDLDGPVVVVNCDQYIDFEMPEYTSPRQGFLPIYANFGSKSSYVEIRDGRIIRIVEKENISNLASAGVYGLDSGKSLIYAIEKQFNQKQMINDEYYVGPALNNLIEEGYDLVPTAVRAKYDLGNVRGIDCFRRTVCCEQTAGSEYEAV